MYRGWGVWCEVWGGVTGFRQSWLKRDDAVVEFETEAEARIKADELKVNAVGMKAQFNYSPRRLK